MMTNIIFSGGMSKSQKKKSAKKKAAADAEINKMLENTHVSNNRTGMVDIFIITVPFLLHLFKSTSQFIALQVKIPLMLPCKLRTYAIYTLLVFL